MLSAVNNGMYHNGGRADLNEFAFSRVSRVRRGYVPYCLGFITLIAELASDDCFPFCDHHIINTVLLHFNKCFNSTMDEQSQSGPFMLAVWDERTYHEDEAGVDFDKVSYGIIFGFFGVLFLCTIKALGMLVYGSIRYSTLRAQYKFGHRICGRLDRAEVTSGVTEHTYRHEDSDGNTQYHTTYHPWTNYRLIVSYDTPEGYRVLKSSSVSRKLFDLTNHRGTIDLLVVRGLPRSGIPVGWIESGCFFDCCEVFCYCFCGSLCGAISIFSAIMLIVGGSTLLNYGLSTTIFGAFAVAVFLLGSYCVVRKVNYKIDLDYFGRDDSSLVPIMDPEEASLPEEPKTKTMNDRDDARNNLNEANDHESEEASA